MAGLDEIKISLRYTDEDDGKRVVEIAIGTRILGYFVVNDSEELDIAMNLLVKRMKEWLLIDIKVVY